MVRLAISPRLRTSPYYEATLAAGMTDATIYNHMVMPTSYGDPAAEYHRLLEAVAVWDVACERQVEVVGADAARLVQYLCSRDLSTLQVGQARYVALCDHDGRLINDPVLLRLGEARFWLSLADSDVLLWVKAVAEESGFDVAVSEPDASPLAVQGPLAEDVVATLVGDWVRDLRYFWFGQHDLDGIPLLVARSGWSKQGGFELYLLDETRGTDLWDAVMEAGAPHGIGPGAPNHVERVESGLLSYGTDTYPDSNPFEAGLGRYVDVDVDVEFIGKAALRRIAAEGPRRTLTGLLVEGVVDSSQPLDRSIAVHAGDTVVGRLSAMVRSPRLGRTIALAQVETARLGDELRIPDGRMVVPTALPFV
ncbi:MAG TPA: glycine cleavage system protein T [Acidimicrobiia bacterium]|jgi:aminomethyltransferase